MIHVLLSMVHIAADLGEEDRRAVARAGISYHILNNRNGRVLVSATLPEESMVDTFMAYFDAKGRQCKVIGEWYPQGHSPGQELTYDEETPVVSGVKNRPFDDEEFLDRIPDKDDIGGRHVESFQLIKPFGWDDWR
jgi:hypothetical protein